jgi:proteasome accessory factor A
MTTADRLDWTAKLVLMDGFRDREDLDWDHAKLHMLDLQYHDIDPAKGLYHRLVAAGRMRRLFDDAEVGIAVARPPEDTRAYFRGNCVARYGPALVAANWDSLVFDVGEDTLKRVPMMEPLRGTRERVEDLLDRSPDAASLIRFLGGDDG